MAKLSLNENNEVLLKTTLTAGQVAKFNVLQEKLVIKNGAAYIPVGELHGVLLTSSKNRAKEIIKSHKNTVKNYFVSPSHLGVPGKESYILPSGLFLLLEELATSNPKRSVDYRASSALLAYIVAAHPQLAFDGQVEARKAKTTKELVFTKLKKKHKKCQLSNQSFGKGVEKHVHHIVAESVDPKRSAEESNLIVIAGDVHDDYHSWVRENKYEVNKQTLKNFARKRGYSLEWAESKC